MPLTARPARRGEVVAVARDLGEREAVGVVAVQADLAAGAR